MAGSGELDMRGDEGEDRVPMLDTIHDVTDVHQLDDDGRPLVPVA